MKLVRTNIILLISMLIAMSFATIATAQPHPVPIMDGLAHTGVPSCATAGCHGDQVTGDGAGPVVGQNEYFQWRSSTEKGAHSRAYEVLLTPHAKRIANNLGVGAAQKAAECLDCHADNVASEQRSQRFQISDGVGCEACHGGAQNWLAFHRIGAGHEKNIEAGLYPTEDPVARARLCFGCHLGSSFENQFVNHRIMGAGHPRLKFELDLYTTVQQHHRVDDGYRQRKSVAPGAQVWAIGQALGLERTLELLLDNKTGRSGVFPELVFFDCHSCHQPISNGIADLDWRPNPGRSVGPGMPILNDANLIMLQAVMSVIDPGVARRLESEGRSLHMASLHSGSQFRASAETLRAIAADAADSIMTADLADASIVRGILLEIVGTEQANRYTNYAAAEQALFAIQRLGAALQLEGPEFTDSIEKASGAVQSPYTYNQNAFKTALSDISRQIGR